MLLLPDRLVQGRQDRYKNAGIFKLVHGSSHTLMMVCVRRGTAINTPKKASPRDHSSSCPGDSTIGPNGGFCRGVIIPSAGIIPTNPVQRIHCYYPPKGPCVSAAEH